LRSCNSWHWESWHIYCYVPYWHLKFVWWVAHFLLYYSFTCVCPCHCSSSLEYCITRYPYWNEYIAVLHTFSINLGIISKTRNQHKRYIVPFFHTEDY
jgi:hypothetical protein